MGEPLSLGKWWIKQKHYSDLGSDASSVLACIASVSAGVCRESWDERVEKKGTTGEGEGREGNACPQTPSLLHSRF